MTKRVNLHQHVFLLKFTSALWKKHNIHCLKVNYKVELIVKFDSSHISVIINDSDNWNSPRVHSKIKINYKLIPILYLVIFLVRITTAFLELGLILKISPHKPVFQLPSLGLCYWHMINLRDSFLRVCVH